MNILLILIFIIYVWKFWFANKYQYRVTVFSGKTGSGKSMLATAKALKLIKKGVPVFCTYYIKGSMFLPYDFYNYNYPEGSVLIIDEGQISFDSRDYAKLFKEGISTKLKNKLSMHRHQKLDIWFITQNVADIDAQIRRYCSELYYCDFTLFRKIFSFDGELNIPVIPYFQMYQLWPDIDSFERYKKSIDPTIKPRYFGMRRRFKFISAKVFNSYNTNQHDLTSSILPVLKIKQYKDHDFNGLIDTKVIR